MSLPPTRQLEAFLAVAEARSFRLAADRLGMSQPALSQNVAQLEAHLGMALFLRSTRSVRLTAEGAELRSHLSGLLPALREALDRTRNFGTDPGVPLRLGFLASAAARYLPHALGRFRAEFPDVAVHARDDTAEGLFAAVDRGELDLAVSSYLPHKDLAVEFTQFRADPFMAVLRRDHPLASRERITWAELLDYDFIGANAGSGTRFITDEAMRAINRPARTVMDFNHFTAVAAMVSAGMGVSALSALTCPPADDPLLCAVPLCDPAVTRNLGIITSNREGTASRHASRFQEHVIEAARLVHDAGRSAA
ncbi:LysR family transcriptional regulator [Mangrovicoccus ximenensis]|uniref:LysR family transcriptional regulator n=1 Tax=Mangrovicoccus ximenensis TaxID=1911570 RepID=UPI000D3A5E26|nr:LysR family transcriptional regulator [Mangrovicoccus ximenensis]